MKVIDDLYCDLAALANVPTTEKTLSYFGHCVTTREAAIEAFELDGAIKLARSIVAQLDRDYIQRDHDAESTELAFAAGKFEAFQERELLDKLAEDCRGMEIE